MKNPEIPSVDEEPLEFIKGILAKDCEFIKASGGIDAFLGETWALPGIIPPDTAISDTGR